LQQRRCTGVQFANRVGVPVAQDTDIVRRFGSHDGLALPWPS
jgi:hypothetical protein